MNASKASKNTGESVEAIPRRLLYPIPEARELLGGLSQSGFYHLVQQGVVHLTKMGRRSFVSDDEIRDVAARASKQGVGTTKPKDAPAPGTVP